MKQLTCDCCGAPMNRASMRCEYCGTQYRTDIPESNIVINSGPCIPLATKIDIPMEVINAVGLEKASEFVMKDLIKQMADALIPFVDVSTQLDVSTWRCTATAKCRVIKPDYRF